MPVSIVLRYKDGVWAVDSGKDGEDVSDKNVLTWMVSRAGPICSVSLSLSSVTCVL
jgi:hypothetical protein